MKKKNSKSSIIIKYIILIFFAVLMFFPIFWIVSNSLKTLAGISEFPPQLFPKKPHWENYIEVLKKPETLGYFRNTLILVVGSTVGTLLSSSIVAYPLARMEFKGAKAIFGIILATMMVPSVTLIVPQFLLFKQFG